MNFTQDDKTLIIKRFLSGETIRHIADDYNVKYISIYRIVKKFKEPRFSYHSFSMEAKNDIKSMYLSGYSTVKIAKKYNTSHKTIARVLDEYEIKRIGNGRRKYKLDEHYFDVIDTPNKAYILGLLYADGSNGKSKSTITISLQEEDVDLLERIRTELKSEKPLEYLDYSNKHDFGYHYKNQYRLLFFSAHMCRTLEAIGMVPNKSLVLTFPDIDPTLHSHFIRGYFDGDGCFCKSLSKGIISFTSTHTFCKSIQDIFIENLGISGGIYDASCHNGCTAAFSISGNRQVKKILDWLYNDADIYLERKYYKYIDAYYSEVNSFDTRLAS